MIQTAGLIDTWIYATLSGDSTLMGLIGNRLVGTDSPAANLCPFVVFTMSSSRDIRAVDGTLIDTSNLYQVKAVSLGTSWDQAKAIADRFDTLLDLPHTVVTLAGGSLTCTREGIIQYPEVVTGQDFRHLGATYRIRANSN